MIGNDNFDGCRSRRSSVRSKIAHEAGAFVQGAIGQRVHRIKEQPLSPTRVIGFGFFDPDPNSPVLGLGRRERRRLMNQPAEIEQGTTISQGIAGLPCTLDHHQNV